MTLREAIEHAINVGHSDQIAIAEFVLTRMPIR